MAYEHDAISLNNSIMNTYYDINYDIIDPPYQSAVKLGIIDSHHVIDSYKTSERRKIRTMKMLA